MKKLFKTILLLSFILNTPFALAEAVVPVDIIKSITDEVLSRVESDKDQLKNNPGEMYDLVSDLVFPNFDFAVMSRFVLGSYWDQANVKQKGEFIDQFRKLLVRTYASALLEFSNQTIEYPTDRNVVKEKTAKIVQVVITQGEPITVIYRLHNTKDKWLAFDVSVSGVSLVKTYRGSFKSIIETEGLDQLINSLKEKNKKFGNS
ncbi:ABC transporter substrate-binding protein [Pseudomonadota bacterium]|nr:ABC transporter substrate-binding protein [Pseudomonadota bacterium]